MVDGGQNTERFGIVLQALDADGTLAGCGEHFLDHGHPDSFGNEVLAEAIDRRFCQKESAERVALEELAEACAHVASDFHCLEIGAQKEELIFAAQAGGGDNGPQRQSLPTAVVFRGQAVGVVLALKDGSHDELRREFGGEVFQAVDGGMDFAAQQGFFEFLGEESLVE